MLTSPTDGSLIVARSNATTLWHIDAVEWAPNATHSRRRAMSVSLPTPDVLLSRKKRRSGPISDQVQRSKIAHYSITSSARPSNGSGTVMPSALAVLRLITSSYLVGACTGRSAGVSPLRMRST